MAVISEKDVKQIAKLSRLKLEGKELAHIAEQIDTILGYIKQLQSVTTKGVKPTSHVLPLSNVMRSDENIPSLAQDEVVKLAPDSHHPFIKVPKVID